MGHAPENTLKSIQIALDMACDAIEIDVHLVEDTLVVIHDNSVDRLTQGHGYVADFTIEQIKGLRVHKTEPIPTLQDVIDLIAGRCVLNIEIKSRGGAEAVMRLIHAALDAGWESNQFLVSSFYHQELDILRVNMPEIRRGVLLMCIPSDLAKIGEDHQAYSINVSHQFVDAEFVNDAHARGLKVFVYTVNLPQDIQKMRDIKVDGVFTNYPELILCRSSEEK